MRDKLANPKRKSTRVADPLAIYGEGVEPPPPPAKMPAAMKPHVEANPYHIAVMEKTEDWGEPGSPETEAAAQKVISALGRQMSWLKASA